MTGFDSTIAGLVVFVAAIIPGFVAQEARHSLVPRPLRPQSNLSEAGTLILASFWVHFFLLLNLRFWLSICAPHYFGSVVTDFAQKKIGVFSWERRHLLLAYVITSICLSYPFGLLQGWFRLKRPFRQMPFLEKLFRHFGIGGFLDEDPVWYYALRQSSVHENVFLEARMKGNQGYCAGLLKTYGILDGFKQEQRFLPDRPILQSHRGRPVRSA